MPRTAKTYKQHITPEGRVLRCENPDNCPYKGAIHIDATLQQAKFMEETLKEGKKAQAEKADRKANLVAARNAAGIVKTNWYGDELSAIEQENGRYTIKLSNGRVLATDAGLVTGMTREKAVQDWAEHMAPFGAKKVEWPISPDASNVQEITVYDELSGTDVKVGYVFFKPGKGWAPIMSLDELKSKPVGERWGLLTAAAAAEDQYRARLANQNPTVSAQTADTRTAAAATTAAATGTVEEQAEQTLRVRGTKVMHEDAAARALGRMLQANDRVYEARDELTAKVRRAFTGMKTPASLKADEGDMVYVHEVRDEDNEIDSVTVKWGARSWSHEEITFNHMGKESPYTEFQSWLNRHNK